MNNTIAIPQLQFAPISLTMRERYLAVTADACRDADHAFANLYIWNEAYRQEMAFAEVEGGCRAVIRFCSDSSYRYLFPAGRGDLAPVIEAMRQKARQRGEFLTLAGVTEDQLEAVNAACPNAFTTTEERDIADYLYSAESLATLAGKKLHGKRNHINAFAAAHSFELLPLAPERFADCRAILDAWAAERDGQTVQNERVAIERAFDAFEALSLEGALLTVDGVPAAFTISSMITADTLCVHVEKALPALQGAYPVINREFVRMMREKHPALSTVNREDDMGLENLRKAKLAYRPTILLTKYTLTEVG